MCSYQDVVDYLNLTADNSVFKMTRPVLDYTHPTVVQLDIILYAILAVVGAALSGWCIIHLLNVANQLICSDVCVCVCAYSQIERTQTFIPFVWVIMVSFDYLNANNSSFPP